MSIEVKNPDVAGMFYPADPNELSTMLDKFIKDAKETDIAPKAIVAPHAGYIYSGPIAASAYKSLQKIKDKVKNVVILSPSHRYPFRGIAVHSAGEFKTPLGKLKVNKEIIEAILKFEQVNVIDRAFLGEHALEVHLPFIQKIFQDITIVPLIVGMTHPSEVAEVLESIWDNNDTIFIVSSDLSHFHSYNQANKLDANTTKHIEKFEAEAITGNDACGYYPLKGLLQICKKRNYKVFTIDQRNSGDTAGEKNQVVGYGSYLFYL